MYFRKRLTPEILGEINEMILSAARKAEHRHVVELKILLRILAFFGMISGDFEESIFYLRELPKHPGY
ncbi:hypothetical protein [Oscillibacter sp.]|uniref:hypothetical protein n=1 Tax=Oscillibacter sp. TaxID=1945593 RepID=UPI00339A43CB